MVQIIAEIGVNWPDLDEAKGMIRLAQYCGADMAKFQYFREEDIATHPLRERLLPLCMTVDRAKELIDYGSAIGMKVFFTPENEYCVNDLEQAGNPIYKMGHNNWKNQKLLQKILRTGKPMIISVPAPASIVSNTIDENRKLKFLYCNPHYPTADEDVKLPIFGNDSFEGFSDHTQGITAACAAVARGAAIIEKHVMLSEGDPIDKGVSVTFEEFARMVKEIRRIEVICR